MALPFGVRLRRVSRHDQECLNVIMEWRRKHDRHRIDVRLRETEPLLEKCEIAARRQRRTRDDGRLDATEKIFAQDGREIERYGRRGDALLAPFALEPAYGWRAGRRSQRLTESVRCAI